VSEGGQEFENFKKNEKKTKKTAKKEVFLVSSGKKNFTAFGTP